MSGLVEEFESEPPRDEQETHLGKKLLEVGTMLSDPLVDLGNVVCVAWGCVAPLLRYDRTSVAIKLEHQMNILQLAYAEQEWTNRLQSSLQNGLRELSPMINHFLLADRQKQHQKQSKRKKAQDAKEKLIKASPSLSPAKGGNRTRWRNLFAAEATSDEEDEEEIGPTVGELLSEAYEEATSPGLDMQVVLRHFNEVA